jgi:hypothetical protein
MYSRPKLRLSFLVVNAKNWAKNARDSILIFAPFHWEPRPFPDSEYSGRAAAGGSNAVPIFTV